VDDAGTTGVLAARDALPEKRVYQCPRRIPSTRMHHEPSRLVDDQKVLVLENHRDGYLLQREALLG
jgi:hypothetical protein